jgi:hypothetical protein
MNKLIRSNDRLQPTTAMYHRFVSALLVFCFAAGVSAGAMAQSNAGKGNFSGGMTMTTDEKWRVKFQGPAAAQAMSGSHNTAVVPYGKNLFVLIFFTNPEFDSKSNVEMRCDFKITNPTGKVQLTQDNKRCGYGRLNAEYSKIYLSDLFITFSGDPGDPPGTWLVEVKLRELDRPQELVLRGSFDLKK